MRAKLAIAGAGTLVLAIALVVGLTAASGQPTATPTPTPSPSALVPASCGDWKLVSDPHEQFRVVTDGFKGMSAEQVRVKSIEVACHNQFMLAQLVEATGISKSVKDQTLITNGYINSRGQKLWSEVTLRLSMAKVRNEPAPATGVNTNIKGSQRVRETGVTGDRAATRFDMMDGSTFWIMHRCGNVVTPGKPSTTVRRYRPPSHHVGGKDARRDVLRNSQVPSQVRGSGAGGSQGSATDNNHPGTTGCGVHKHCPRPTPPPNPGPTPGDGGCGSCPPPTTDPPPPPG